MEIFLSTLASQGFLEKALLLVLGALLTGMLVPLVKARMDTSTFERQKVFEAHVARQSDVIKAQTQFLGEFSHHMWEYHMISQRVSYEHLSGDKASYERALEEYRDSVWECLRKIRSAIGAARWFCSDTAHQALTSWYEDWFVKLEGELRQLIAGRANRQKWTEHQWRVHYEASERNYELLRFLAEEFGLRSIVEGRAELEMSRERTIPPHLASRQPDEVRSDK